MRDHSNIIIHINISFRNTTPSDALKSRVTEKLENVMQKFLHRDTSAEVVLSVEKKDRHVAEVHLQADGSDVKASAESSDLYASIDALADSLTTQLRRHKERMKEHHKHAPQ